MKRRFGRGTTPGLGDLQSTWVINRLLSGMILQVGDSFLIVCVKKMSVANLSRNPGMILVVSTFLVQPFLWNPEIYNISSLPSMGLVRLPGLPGMKTIKNQPLDVSK